MEGRRREARRGDRPFEERRDVAGGGMRKRKRRGREGCKVTETGADVTRGTRGESEMKSKDRGATSDRRTLDAADNCSNPGPTGRKVAAGSTAAVGHSPDRCTLRDRPVTSSTKGQSDCMMRARNEEEDEGTDPRARLWPTRRLRVKGRLGVVRPSRRPISCRHPPYARHRWSGRST